LDSIADRSQALVDCRREQTHPLSADPRVDRPTMTSPADAYLHDETDLDLSSKEIDCKKAKRIAHQLETNTTLTNLKLRENKIGDNGASAIANALTKNRTLMSIELRKNSFSDVGVVAIAMALLHNDSLKELYLGDNGIGPAGAAAFAETLRTNTCLQKLSLFQNSIGDNGMEAVAGALAANQSLVSLSFSTCNIGNAGTAALAQALKHNTTLTHLFFGANNFSTRGLATIAFALTENKVLTRFHLYNNSINDDQASILAEMLKRNASLKVLGLQGNNIGDDGAMSILDALTECNTTLTSLVLTSNANISSSILSAIEDVVKANAEGTRFVIHPIARPAPNPTNPPSASIPPQAPLEQEPASEATQAPGADMPQITAMQPTPILGASVTTFCSLMSTQDPDEDETKWMEGLPKQRAELEYEIHLLATIRDLTFQQAVETKINLIQRAIATGKYRTGDELEQMVNDLTGEIQEKAPSSLIENLLQLQSDLTREREAEVRVREAMSKCGGSEAISDAHGKALSALTTQLTATPGTSASSVSSLENLGTQDSASDEGGDTTHMILLPSQRGELDLEIRRVAEVRDAAETIIRLLQTAVATGKYPTGEELEGMINQMTSDIQE
jgi:Ran GTPase-activating protein (RanGAP) involved in mRNA processing and transport